MYHPKVIDYFKGDMEKVILWYRTSNPHLGWMQPVEMIVLGRERKLNKFIKNTIEGNIA